MILVSVPEECRVNYEVSKDKFIEGTSTDSVLENIESICWWATIKPEIVDVKPHSSEKRRYEEIQFLDVKLHDRNMLFEIGTKLYSQIKYPCVMEFHIEDVTVLGACSFRPGKRDYSDNVEKRVLFSHFMRKELLSPQAIGQIESINAAISEQQDLEKMYSDICYALVNYKLGGTSRAHVDRWIEDMLGKTKSARKDEIRRYCTPYEFHAPIEDSGRFKNKRKMANYTLIHDYEEIWYSFMMDPQVKMIIEKRGYKDLERLAYSIDSKEW